MVDAPSGLGVQLLQRLHSKMKICKYLVPLGRLWAPYYFSCCYKFLEHRIIFILRLYLLGSMYGWARVLDLSKSFTTLRSLLGR